MLFPQVVPAGTVTEELDGLSCPAYPMPFPPKREHAISLEDAAELTRRYRESAAAGAHWAYMFPREVYEQLLAQPGCMGIRAYAGIAENGARKQVLVGVDSEGSDMTVMVFDFGFPCPPYCGGGNSPLRQ